MSYFWARALSTVMLCGVGHLAVGCAASEPTTAGSGAEAGDGGVDVVSQGEAGQKDAAQRDHSVDVSSAPDSGKHDASEDVSFAYDGPAHDGTVNVDSACANVTVEAHKMPVDVVFVVDNSASMAQEIHGVEVNINEHFVQIIEASGIDYRVIMISGHGDWHDNRICVKAPLSGTDCDPLPAIPSNNPPIFFHYSYEVASHDSWQVLLNTYDGTTPDEFGLAPGGWRQWLRAGAFKVLVGLTDDGVKCGYGAEVFDDHDTVAGGKTAAQRFDQALLALSPSDFGTPDRRNYVWYSIVCLAANNPSTEPWKPTDPIQAQECSSTNCQGPGTGYQALSVLTDGWRYPLCNTSSYDAVFQGIAKNVVGSLACKFAVPPVQTDAGIIDPSKVLVRFTPSQGPQESWPNVHDASSCTGKQWYYDDNADPKTILLCPAACSQAKLDGGAKIEILLGCAGS